MTAHAPLALPGLRGTTVLVTAAGTRLGVAQCLVLVASGAAVVAVDAGPRPAALIDAGTGLPGRLDYRDGTAGWDAVADWVGEHAAGVQGLVLPGEAAAPEALRAHLDEHASVVVVGDGDLPAGLRANRVVPAADADPEAVAAAVGFLLSAPARGIRGATVPCQ
ncbi:MAG TPA: hypothetical protein VNR36_03455 [Pseudolysinimonas sp.]|nr:hypothetical protein [Pseudolysinimonas sp.]